MRYGPKWGTSGNDYLTGSQWNDDQIYGRAGHDTIFGEGGDNYLDGGGGDDLLFGGTGDDTIKGGAGSNGIMIGQGADTVIFDGSARYQPKDYIIFEQGYSTADDTLFFVGDHWVVSYEKVADAEGQFVDTLSVYWSPGWNMDWNFYGTESYGMIDINIEFASEENLWPS